MRIRDILIVDLDIHLSTLDDMLRSFIPITEGIFVRNKRFPITEEMYISDVLVNEYSTGIDILLDNRVTTKTGRCLNITHGPELSIFSAKMVRDIIYVIAKEANPAKEFIFINPLDTKETDSLMPNEITSMCYVEDVIERYCDKINAELTLLIHNYIIRILIDIVSFIEEDTYAIYSIDIENEYFKIKRLDDVRAIRFDKSIEIARFRDEESGDKYTRDRLCDEGVSL